MNRRKFLQSLVALGGSACIPAAIAVASESVIEEVWQCVTESPTTFYVNEYGTISTDLAED